MNNMDELPPGTKNVRVRRAETVVRSEPVPETKPAAEKPKVQKIDAGKVVIKKPGLGARFKEMLFGGETNGVGRFLVEHVIVPAAKDMVADAVREGVERMVYGESRGPNVRRGGGSTFNAGTNYSGFSNNRSSLRPDPASDPRPTLSRQARRNHNFGEIVLGSRAAATEILRALDARIKQYDSVSVSELYQMLDVTPDWTDEKYGWYDISTASVRSARGGGYLLDLPPTEPLS